MTAIRWDDMHTHEVEHLRFDLNAAQRDRDRWADQYQQVKTRLALADAAVSSLLEATGGVTVEYQFQGAFTIAVLVDPISERVFTGAACCNAKDRFNAEIGKAISLGRAMHARGEYFAEAAFAK